MKDFYKISEMSGLYDICTDSLRYYEELGILSPKRDTNGYRLYSLTDIWKLNVIKDLRELDFPMKRIKEYLDNRTIDTTVELLLEEKELVNQKLEKLTEIQRSIDKRLAGIAVSRMQKTDEITVKQVDRRKCIQVRQNVVLDEEVDFLINKLHKKYEKHIYVIGNTALGTLVDCDENGNKKGYSSVFVYDEDFEEYDFELPKGEYACISYYDNYDKVSDYVKKIREFAEKGGYRPMGEPLELMRIDIHATAIRKEYLTEMQIRIEKI